jgi:hypothetical protein
VYVSASTSVQCIFFNLLLLLLLLLLFSFSLLRLQSHINTLKQNYGNLERNTKLEIEKLSKQILKARQNIIELEDKSDHFTRVNEKQYLDIWNMNTQNANELVEKVVLLLLSKKS